MEIKICVVLRCNVVYTLYIIESIDSGHELHANKLDELRIETLLHDGF